jgi:two-component sensor histidine kinase
MRDITERKQMEDDLREALDRKDVLIKEVHHRTKNNLVVIQSLLSLQIKDIVDDKSRQYFRDAENRVKSMIMIHDLLHRSDDITKMRSRDYIEKLVRSLFYSYKADAQAIKLQYHIQDIIMDVDTMIPLGLIINELVSNVLKYAFPDGAEGELGISLKRTEENSNELIIKDSGAGLPEDFDPKKAKSLGLWIVNTLVKQVEGALVVSNKDGTEFRITFA